ncbi:MAG: radical SAM protein [Saprospiraceae bacterium]
MKVLLITPPFTQLNTSYPATSYLKGFLNTLNVESVQADLSLEVILKIFSSSGLRYLFNLIQDNESELSENTFRIFNQRNKYISSIDSVIAFLHNTNPTLAHTICNGGFLPEASRFSFDSELLWAFGSMGVQDKARHLSTLYLEDLGDLITEVIDPYFGFSRYAERIARTATHFDDIYDELKVHNTIISDFMLEILDEKIREYLPSLICITVPFPGNVFSTFKCGQFIKTKYPAITVAIGGGYANTELRKVYDDRVFEFIDYITLDDGEAPLQHLIEYLNGERSKSALKRTFCLEKGSVTYINGSKELDIAQKDVGTPDYSDLKLDKYLSVIEVINPMHRLWSDGRWNKITLAHGCYWGKCSFCDVTLDYIKKYEPVSAAQLCDRLETIISQTGQNGFHFVDEAAPPALLRDLALEIIKRDLTIVWWTNIRFEKSFTLDLCRLLKMSGCIAISGGLEVASDRLLTKMKKGVTVAQVSRVAHSFTSFGIMVHAYLMYGFPTQSIQETIDSLEMVRQMFVADIIQSGFWHQFAMTAHSPVGLEPKEFQVINTGPTFGGFAENDLFHEDPTGADHEIFSNGLKQSIYNFMQDAGLEKPLQTWFDFRIPQTLVPENYIELCLTEVVTETPRPHDRFIWIGGDAVELIFSKVKKKKKDENNQEYAEIIFSDIKENYTIYIEKEKSEWLINQLGNASPHSNLKYTYQDMSNSYEESGFGHFSDFYNSGIFIHLMEKGMLLI